MSFGEVTRDGHAIVGSGQGRGCGSSSFIIYDSGPDYYGCDHGYRGRGSLLGGGITLLITGIAAVIFGIISFVFGNPPSGISCTILGGLAVAGGIACIAVHCRKNS